MDSYSLPVTYSQLATLRMLLDRPACLDKDEARDVAQLRAFVALEMARAHRLARECLDCG